MIHIAMIGVAHPHADHWARAWHMHTEAELAGVWDADPERAAKWAEQFGVRRYETLEALLGDPAIDAVGICSENSRHAEYTVAAAAADKDILCEKPTAVTLEDCDRMIKAVEQAGVRFMQAFPMRLDPVNTRIKKMLEEHEIGTVTTFRKRHGIGWAATGELPEKYRWFTHLQEAGGGAFLDEGIHAADFLIWMFGKPVSVTARIAEHGRNVPVDDNGIAIVEFADGIVGSLHSSWLFEAASVTTEIFGTEGTIMQQANDCASTAVNGENNFPLQVYSRKSGMKGWQNPRIPINFMQIHEKVASCFADCLISGDPFPSTLYNGRDALELILGAYRSASEGRTICFQEVE